MTFVSVLALVVALGAALVVYHHVLYPVILRLAARKTAVKPAEFAADAPPPRVSIIVPAYREAAYIADKIYDLASLDYPIEALEIVIACDGSPDATPEIASNAVKSLGKRGRHIRLVSFAENRGKVAVLNEMIEAASGEVVVLMDSSAGNTPDFLRRLLAAFGEADVGVVCAGYKLSTPGSAGEAAYWRYQINVKKAEAALAAPMGAHGAAYAFLKSLWKPMPKETINDDFVLPMQIVAGGAEARYVPEVAVVEREVSRPEQDFARRRRIGAGNLQQVWFCRALASLKRPKLAFVFLSGKALRGAMPFLLAGLFVASALLALTGRSVATTLPLVMQLAFYGLALIGVKRPTMTRFRLVAYPHYFATGYWSALMGSIDLLRGRFRDERRFAALPGEAGVLFVDPTTDRLKRVFDILVGLCAFAGFLVLLVPLAIAIRLDSKGPIFYRQLRVGRALPDRTELFHLIKFRTMRVDAEAASGAVWAAKGDPRVTRLGRFMRKTRLDELPQCLNVLMGEMSIVGPRPERPVFFTKLETAIPFYAERTYGLKPGVTGLAQVSTGYDATIDDVRLKILFDHTYALRIRSPLEWLKTDLAIVFKTIAVMGLGMGR